MRRVGLVLALGALALAMVPPASAHADLLAADPPVNGHGPVGVTVLTLTFSEDVVRDQYSGVIAKDLAGKSIASGPVQFDDAHRNVMRLPVHSLGDGIYTVEWKTLSTDTHTLHGGYVFTIGNATIATPPAPPRAVDEFGLDTLDDGAARFVFYSGLFVALGVPVFLLAIDRDAAKPRRASMIAGLAALVGGAGSVASLYFLAVRTDGYIVDTAVSDAGEYITARAALVGLAGATLLVAAATRSQRPRKALLSIAIAFAALATIATSLASHAAADREYRDISVTLDALHLTMGGLWIGGVVAFSLTQWGKTSQQIATVVTRFTPLALVSVGLVLATGTWASLRHIPRLSDMWTTTYGLLVSAKIALLGVLILIGAVNKQIMGPRLRSAKATPRTFRRVLQIEATTMALVVLAAGVLASTSPPQLGVQTGTQIVPHYLELTTQTGEYHVVVDVAPNPPTIGPTQIIVALHPFNPPLPASTSVQLQFQDPGTTQPRDVTETPISSGPNEWTLNGFAFSSSGVWKMYVLVQTKTFNKFVFNVTVEARG